MFPRKINICIEMYRQCNTLALKDLVWKKGLKKQWVIDFYFDYMLKWFHLFVFALLT